MTLFFFLSLLKCRARRPNQRQPNTKVRAKGVDLTWSQVCSPLLQFPSVHAHSTVLAAVGVGRVGEGWGLGEGEGQVEKGHSITTGMEGGDEKALGPGREGLTLAASC